MRLGAARASFAIAAVVALVGIETIPTPTSASASGVATLSAEIHKGGDGIRNEGVSEDPREHERLLDIQQPIVDFTISVRGYVEQQKLVGLIDVSIDAKSNSASIFWHGWPPKDLTDFVERAAKGFDVKFVEGKYSKAELLAEASRLFYENRGLIVSAGPNSTFSGIKVGVNPTKATLESVHFVSRMPAEVHPKLPPKNLMAPSLIRLMLA
jgi:hypothetical protein